jgi:hypothetical protein
MSEEAATPALNTCLDKLYARLAELPPVVGVVTLRLEVQPALFGVYRMPGTRPVCQPPLT